MQAIRFENVSKRFVLHHQRPHSFQELLINALKGNESAKEELWALKDVSFGVEQGETLGIIGENGSGKSTILKLIARILEPTEGEITVEGRVSALLELGAGFHPDLTGRENIYLNGSLLGLSKREMDARFDQIVEFSELGRFIDVPVKHYSSGMYMRLGFSVAAHVNPDVLLIDEVLAVGDEAFQRKCVDKINEFKSGEKTIIFVSHNLGLVRRLCDRVIWLNQGVINSLGSAEEVINEYLKEIREREVVREEKQRKVEPILEIPKGKKGDSKINIYEMKLLDGNGDERYTYYTGEAMVVRLYYEVIEPQPTLTFGVGVHRSDDVYVHGTTITRQACERTGIVELTYERLPLLTGTYLVSVKVWLGNERRGPCDIAAQTHEFSIWGGGKHEGMIALPHGFAFTGEETAQDHLPSSETGLLRPPSRIIIGENDVHFLDQGWYDIEDQALGKLRWTKKKASAFLMPDRSSTQLFIRICSPHPAFNPQEGTVYADGQKIGDFRLVDTDLHIFSFPLPQLEAERVITVTIEVGHTIVPAQAGIGPDPRELGLIVQAIWVE